MAKAAVLRLCNILGNLQGTLRDVDTWRMEWIHLDRYNTVVEWQCH